MWDSLTSFDTFQLSHPPNIFLMDVSRIAYPTIVRRIHFFPRLHIWLMTKTNYLLPPSTMDTPQHDLLLDSTITIYFDLLSDLDHCDNSTSTFSIITSLVSTSSPSSHYFRSEDALIKTTNKNTYDLHDNKKFTQN